MARKARLVGAAVILVVALLVVAGCSVLPSATPTPASTVGAAGIANPASTYCVERGYKLEIRGGENGQSGFCVFPDGSECDEWAFFRGQCGVSWQTPAR